MTVLASYLFPGCFAAHHATVGMYTCSGSVKWEDSRASTKRGFKSAAYTFQGLHNSTWNWHFPHLFPIMFSALFLLIALWKSEMLAAFLTTYTFHFCHIHRLICYFWVVLECWTVVDDWFFFFLFRKKLQGISFKRKKKELRRKKITHIRQIPWTL